MLAVGGQRFAYAESLVRMAELSRVRSSGGQSPPYAAAVASLGADGRGSQLRERILRICAARLADPTEQRYFFWDYYVRTQLA